ncbi:hypothetical protein Bca52824_051422 [Brassica carinata]|uniref:Uncharacterized protein n=1 Tax=Brassica carinata TaxID=52824 RepID=A0A8X7UIN5_BRACI|nr:hypothetical protein Bca52824_051422 [Brassica carinata]
MKLDLVSKSIGSIIELPGELSSPALTVLDSTYTLINHVGKVGMAFRDVKGSAFKLWILSEPGDWIPMRVSTEIFNQDPLVNRTVSFEGSISDGRLVFNVVLHDRASTASMHLFDCFQL